MSLKERIQQDVKDAMRAKEKERLATIRLITAAIKQREVDERIELDDEQVLVVLDKMCKQRRESISQFEKAGRDDLIAQEVSELDIIKTYLPEQLGEDEIAAMIDAVMADTHMPRQLGLSQSEIFGLFNLHVPGGRVDASTDAA